VWKNINYNIEFSTITFLLSIGIRKTFNLNLNNTLSKLKVYIVDIIGGLLYYLFIILLLFDIIHSIDPLLNIYRVVE